MNEDSGIWELEDEHHYTLSKMGCWVALDRAQELAARGEIPDDRVRTWSDSAERIRDYVERECWSTSKRSYTFYAGSGELDAAVLLAARNGYCEQAKDRLDTTIDAVMLELARGPLVYRYSGQEGVEGAFLPCSFWVVSALAYCGRRDEARELMDELVQLSNDVGLYAEEMDPTSRRMLGNFPQALTHLALINAAVSIGDDA
jgi:GH15 family glucan-1,4-alpha-glucosidase